MPDLLLTYLAGIQKELKRANDLKALSLKLYYDEHFRCATGMEELKAIMKEGDES